MDEQTDQSLRKRIIELEQQLAERNRLLNNWLAWYEMGGGSLGALEGETRQALQGG